ncbi:MerR family transcriptional regulator [Nocardioides jejuensis]|uniref:MerR family transcriptional regulator n=1 Tax=Nocardioides jejuensis TaxID=2502782 RepID=A0A4R1C0B8_9ACTN|nr:MerR family transcriptional regulator [Nocardioides jejuensis]TCJ23437.1 MerR family transcriptional regulator [Nocardioides jejuensis]
MSFTIAEMAEQTGLTPHTLRYYERDGLLLGAVDRATSGHRRYSAQDLAWITLITRLRATGMPIRDVKRYAALVRAGDGNESERLDLLLAHRARVEAQLAEITGHLRAVDHKIGIYEGKVEQALTSSALEAVE